jgi:hypothetical protein
VTAVVFASLPNAPAQPPAAVGGVTTSAGPGRVAVSWARPASTGAALDVVGVWAFSAAGYSGRSASVCGTCTSATVDGLVDGTPYVMVVMAHNAAGWGGPGYSSWVTAGGMPGAPAWVTAGGGPARVSSTWAAASPSSSPVDMYMALAYEGSTYSNQGIVTCGGCLNGTISGLSSGHGYTVYVFAHNAYGWGPATASPVATTS